MSDSELEEILDRVGFRNMDRELINQELTRRRLRSMSKPHWTLTPAFWIAVAAMIFAAIAAWPVIQGWILSSPIADKAATVQPQQSQSTEPSPNKAKTSASSNHPSEPPNSKTVGI
jgi:cytoskeletal protein RodZ